MATGQRNEIQSRSLALRLIPMINCLEGIFPPHEFMLKGFGPKYTITQREFWRDHPASDDRTCCQFRVRAGGVLDGPQSLLQVYDNCGEREFQVEERTIRLGC